MLGARGPNLFQVSSVIMQGFNLSRNSCHKPGGFQFISLWFKRGGKIYTARLLFKTSQQRFYTSSKQEMEGVI